MSEPIVSEVCPVCEKDVERHAAWEKKDCAEELQALKRSGLPMSASFLNPGYARSFVSR